MNININVSITQKDYNKLVRYGFVFDRNISDYLHGIAEEIREAEKVQKAARKDPFKRVVSEYTGGGIWLFYGELKSGEHFLTDDNGSTMILDASPENFEESLYEEWQEEHFVRVVGDRAEEKAFLHSLLDRLKRRLPEDEGGYISDEEIERYRKEWDETYKYWGV